MGVVQSELLKHILGMKRKPFSVFEREVTANVFVYLSLWVADKISVDEQNDSTNVEFVCDLIELKNCISEQNIDIEKSIVNLEREFDHGLKETFIEMQLLNKIMLNIQLSVEDAKEDKIITAVEVFKRIIKESTPTLKKCLVTSNDNKQDSEQSVSDEEKARALQNEYIKSIRERSSQVCKRDLPVVDEDDLFSEDDDTFGDELAFGDVAEEVPESKLKSIVENTSKVADKLAGTVFGQDNAVSMFVSGYFKAQVSACSQKTRTKPLVTFLSAGPPGVGKTFLAEQMAKALGLPFKRFDMSEYSDKDSNLMFAGFAQTYKDSKPGVVTDFVAKNPKCVVLFDEIEKAHNVIINLFLQILDAGVIRENFDDTLVAFKDAILIFTTNAGRELYENEDINISTVSRKSVLKALANEISPITKEPVFPQAIISRFASGNVIMFNRMGANNLTRIASKELKECFDEFATTFNLDISSSSLLPNAILFQEGGKADARTVKGRSNAFVYDEIYELLRLINSPANEYDISKIKSISVEVSLPDDPEITSMFKMDDVGNVLLFADEKVATQFKQEVKSSTVFVADSIEEASAILKQNNIAMIVCDYVFRSKTHKKVLNYEDIESEGRKFFKYALEHFSPPIYVLISTNEKIGDESKKSLQKAGAAGILHFSKETDSYCLDKQIKEEVEKSIQQKNLTALATANKVISFQTLQKVSDDNTQASIVLFDFKKTTAIDAEDADSLVDDISKPDVRFADVIGAKDAKEELQYFVEYLKNPEAFKQHDVKTPKGVLLYGPPGTGKTLLAKAMAGESDVTFITAEGNQFLKTYLGEGADSVHKKFQQARKYAPSILFIDEIDAIAKNRVSKSGESTANTLTAFLTEMDGFLKDDSKPVFVLAATNYEIDGDTERSLDPALMRRFDRRILVDLPEKEERLQYLNMKLGKLKSQRVSEETVSNIATRSIGWSLAEIESMIELALRNVIKQKKSALTSEILEEAFESFRSGEIKIWDKNEVRSTAYHEAGHAVLYAISGKTPSYLTVVSRGNHGGYMEKDIDEKKGTHSKQDLLNSIATALGGRAAELVVYGEDNGLTTGASADLRSATSIAQAMICDYGMDKFGFVSIPMRSIMGTQMYSQIVERTSEILAEQLEYAKQCLIKNREILDKLVDELMKKDSLKQDELKEILKDVVKPN